MFSFRQAVIQKVANVKAVNLKSLSQNIMVILVIVATSGCSFVNKIRMRNANDDLVAEWRNSAQEVELRSTYIGEKPYIYASINGVPGFKFLVDTGASITILQDTPKIKALKLEPGYELQLSGWGDEESSPAYQTSADEFEFDGIRFKNINFAYLPISTSKYFFRPDEAIYDGVIGHDVLRHFTWKFDKKEDTITVFNGPYNPKEEHISMPFDIWFSKLEIQGEMLFKSGQKVTHELIIDTGSRNYLKINSLYLENNEIDISQPTIKAADFGLNGRALHQRFSLPRLTLGNLALESAASEKLEVNHIKTNIIRTDDEDDLWVIGSALLNKYVSVVDYHSNRLYLKPYEDIRFHSRFNLLGLELRKIRSGEFVVRYVLPDMAAAAGDFQVGDIVTSINGKNTADMSSDDWLATSASPGRYEVCLKRENSTSVKMGEATESCQLVVSKHIVGYSVPSI
ncbi:aspartyl protease family protein [Aliikangiella coralliicola]|uniref:PDZ domain-containing protein n=1 Tax=Aliikangiella coralliicola TaxID=2592383 RepID=A0A545UC60_9GAMM|nr:aspartyl protease family protein [Aliikangiella coralliicola]TQV87058.1 hypothetical protein FLL46_14730 [Aliikangiella coralliicola]